MYYILHITLLGRFLPFSLKTILGPLFFHCVIAIKRLYENKMDVWKTYAHGIQICRLVPNLKS